MSRYITKPRNFDDDVDWEPERLDPPTITVHEPSSAYRDTGLVDRHGVEILATDRAPMGFRVKEE